MIHASKIGLCATMLDMALRTSPDVCVKCCRLTLKQSGLARVTANTLVVYGTLIRGMTRLAVLSQRRVGRRQCSGSRMTLPGHRLPVTRSQPNGQREDAASCQENPHVLFFSVHAGAQSNQRMPKWIAAQICRPRRT